MEISAARIFQNPVVRPTTSTMEHTWNNLQTSFLIFTVVGFIGVFTAFILSVLSHKVTYYVPFISEAGGMFPEAGIFGYALFLATVLSVIMMALRFLIVEEKISQIAAGSQIKTVNQIGLAMAVLSMASFALVASFPVTTVKEVHNLAATIGCATLIIFFICNAWISSKLNENYTSFRIFLTVFGFICCALLYAFVLLGSSVWVADHPIRLKKPGDVGFAYYVLSASFEWLLLFTFVLYLGTFYSDLKQHTFHFHVARKKPLTEIFPTQIMPSA